MESQFLYSPQIKTELVRTFYSEDFSPLNLKAIEFLELVGNPNPSQELIEKTERFLENLSIAI